MRCYFLRKGHIEGYVPLHEGLDQDMIEEGKASFERAYSDRYDGFEVWRKDRCLYRSPGSCEPSSPEALGWFSASAIALSSSAPS